MQPLFLFSLASRHAEWASVRQAAISGNIANANTPGFKAADVEPFTAVLDKTHLSLNRTSARHMDVAGAGVPTSKVNKAEGWDISHSGNTVSLEQEMLKADEVNRAFSLNTNVVRSFQRMMLASVKT
ncbi:flagellar basal body rod protein FlgB [Roseixanthobacter glucoisosaccharinicivorans]|uniref:flagellar basal body rod protein FlgB n=1 Tax=Roseixanthobacter glucoisosaccharinicivorans TaxID=3119923 RepID=UPI003729EB4F